MNGVLIVLCNEPRTDPPQSHSTSKPMLYNVSSRSHASPSFSRLRIGIKETLRSLLGEHPSPYQWSPSLRSSPLAPSSPARSLLPSTFPNLTAVRYRSGSPPRPRGPTSQNVRSARDPYSSKNARSIFFFYSDGRDAIQLPCIQTELLQPLDHQ